MNFSQFLAVMRARVWLSVAILLVTLGTAIGVGSVLPKKYTATATLVLDQSRPDPIAAAAYWSNPSPAYLLTQVDIIKSDRVALDVVRKLKLAEQEEFRDKWIKATQGTGNFELWIGEGLRKMMDVAPARDSNVIAVEVQAPTPVFAATLANAFAQSYLDVSLALRVNPAKQYSNFFDDRSKELRANLERSQAKLSAFQREKGIVVTDDRLDVEMSRLNELSSQLTALQAVAAESSSRQAQAQGGGGDGLQEVINNPLLASMQSDLARAEGRLQELNSRLGDNHPQVLEAKANISSLRNRLSIETKRVTGSVSVTNTINRQREAEIRGSLEAQKAKILRMKSVRDEGIFLLRDVDNDQRAYESVQTRANQTNLESRVTLSNAYILSEATVPQIGRAHV